MDAPTGRRELMWLPRGFTSCTAINDIIGNIVATLANVDGILMNRCIAGTWRQEDGLSDASPPRVLGPPECAKWGWIPGTALGDNGRVEGQAR